MMPPAKPSVPDPEQAYTRLRDAVQRGIGGRSVALIGVHRGGAWIAERLHADLGIALPCGFLSTAFHRDDYAERRGLPATMRATELPFDVNGANIVLVDDILFTGRSVRAGLNEIFDYGRPACVKLAVLLDRGGRELPIEASYVGGHFPLAPSHNYELSRTGEGAAQHFALAISQAGEPRAEARAEARTERHSEARTGTRTEGPGR